MYRGHASLMELVEGPEKEYRWEKQRTLRVNAALMEKNNLFSRVGIGARTVVIEMHPQEVNLHHAILWEGRHCFLTSVIQQSPVLMEVTAALVDVVECIATTPLPSLNERKRPQFDLPQEQIARFPAVLTEKYAGFEQKTPMVKTKNTFVLVTPKVIRLEPGELVGIGEQYVVRCCHLLDQHKNEYELSREADA